MPTGYYIRTEEYRKKLSEARNRFLQDKDKFNKWKEQVRNANVGNQYAKGSKAWIGRKHTEESKEKMRLKQIGVRPGNYLDGRSHNPIRRKTKNRGPYSHYVYCSQPENLHRIPSGMVIHHKDLNPLNDTPENLIMLPDDYHRSLHNKIIMKINGGEFR
jgi:hypothetical protein